MNLSPHVLIIDDEPNLTFFIKTFLEKQNFLVLTASNLTEAKEYIDQELPDLLLLDLKLPDGDGFEFYRQLRSDDINIPTIIITAHGSVKSAVEALKNGVDDYLIKPFEMDELLHVIKRVLDRYKLSNQLKYYTQQLINRMEGEYFPGTSPVMTEIHELALKIAKVPEATVLIHGPSGSGKEMLARYIHHHSEQKNQPFVEINCAALPHNLLESELFGYEAGAFTDARKRKIGLLELAQGGTLFLDEISEMDIGTQAKLLRVVETRKFKRLGGLRDISVKLRIIAATNKDLSELVKQKKFREDLYYRLNLFEIKIPPLKDRGEDVKLLAQFFLEKFSRKFGKSGIRFSAEALEYLEHCEWPGNVRELRNMIERSLILAEGDFIDIQHLTPTPTKNIQIKKEEIDLSVLNNKSLSEYISKIEQTLLKQALKKAKGNQAKAAEILGEPRHIVRYLIKKYQLK